MGTEEWRAVAGAEEGRKEAVKKMTLEVCSPSTWEVEAEDRGSMLTLLIAQLLIKPSDLVTGDELMWY